MNQKTVASYQSRIEAEQAKSILEEEGISTIIVSDDCGGLRPNLTFISGVDLVVNAKDYSKAKMILKINE